MWARDDHLTDRARGNIPAVVVDDADFHVAPRPARGREETAIVEDVLLSTQDRDAHRCLRLAVELLEDWSPELDQIAQAYRRNRRRAVDDLPEHWKTRDREPAVEHLEQHRRHDLQGRCGMALRQLQAILRREALHHHARRTADEPGQHEEAAAVTER